MDTRDLAIIGSGATAIYCLKHILDNSSLLIKKFKSITIFEKGKEMGFGMPYNPETTDIYNLSNISSEEIPKLPQSLASWLREQDRESLKKWNVTTFPIEDSQVYNRLALGHYFHAQFDMIIQQLIAEGFRINALVNCTVTDILLETKRPTGKVVANNGDYEFSKIVIATGHNFLNTDQPHSGYYGTPWPIKKILPQQSQFYNFEIGILGASLSAFDVVTSLAHRHGVFKTAGDALNFQLHEKAKGFKLTLHAAEGWLPHLQYEQEEPFREIYRYTSREQMLGLRNPNGFIKIETYFNVICRPALLSAFEKDNSPKLKKWLSNPNITFKQFIDEMAENHEYIDSFKGMQKELVHAKDSIDNKKPIHWMETLDDLMYCLNFHAEILSAEDHLFLKKEVLPFLLNVIAALPISSAQILLALYHANIIDLIPGRVTITQAEDNKGHTQVEIVKSEEDAIYKTYIMFIDCSGNDNIDMENYPFKSLVTLGHVRKACAPFESIKNMSKWEAVLNEKDLVSTQKGTFLHLGGIDVDGAYRVINKKGEVEPRIHDLSFTHTYGYRPYSYGLQACNTTSEIMVNSWLSAAIHDHEEISPETLSKIYNKIEE